jgi:hypothetical protein
MTSLKIMEIRFFDLHDIVGLVEPPNRNPIIDAHVDNAEIMAPTPGSRKKHQAWYGGYLDHAVYAANYALMTHEMEKGLGFNLGHNESDIALVMLLHDFGKIVKYRRLGDGWDYVENPDEAEHKFFEGAMQRYGFQLTDNHRNALEFVHGEGSKYTPKGRLMEPLAVACHQADIWNARSTPSHPLPGGKDPWPGAYRHSENPDLVGYIKRLAELRI